jgi:DNA invertase Pin-like site-specific DNA recombinase
MGVGGGVLSAALERARVAIYLRVSTDRQDEANQEPEARRLALQRYPIERFDHVVIREIESGAKDDRPGWSSIIESARKGELHAVVVWSLDRIGRKMWRVLDDVRELDRYLVELVSVREPWCDTSGPTRSLLLSVFAWFAQHEHERLRERTRAGLARAAAQGRFPGRPKLDHSVELLQRAVDLRAGGFTLRQTRVRISAEFGIRLNHDESLRRLFQEAHKKGLSPKLHNPTPIAGLDEPKSAAG